MSEEGAPSLRSGPASRFETWALSLCALVAAIAALVLIPGWGFDVDLVRRLHPSLAAMAPSTASAFLIGAGAVISVYGRWRGRRALLFAIAACAVFAIALADLTVIASGAANGLDHFLMPGVAAFDNASMAPATAICFLFVAACLGRLARRDKGPDLIFVGAATAGLIVALVAVVGYAFDAGALYEVSLFTAMALHTALAFTALFSAFLLLRTDIGWAAILAGEGGGSASARRLLPGAILLPFILCLLALILTNAGLFTANFRASLLAIIMMLLLSAAALRFAAVQNAIERELRQTIAERDLLLREVYHRVKNNLQMTSALLMSSARRVKDTEAKDILVATTKRIEALGAVHRLLIPAAMPSEVEAATFLDALCKNIFSGQRDSGKQIALDLETDDLTIHIDVAIALGLIINELVTNAVRHAFPDRASGTVSVRLRGREDGAITLTVADDGVGAEGLYEDEPHFGGGTRIIQGLVRQLDATLLAAGQRGAVVVVTIPAETLQGGRYE